MVCLDSNYLNLYFINVQLCVKSQVSYHPQEVTQLDRDLVSKKLNSAYGPVLALNIQAL